MEGGTLKVQASMMAGLDCHVQEPFRRINGHLTLKHPERVDRKAFLLDRASDSSALLCMLLVDNGAKCRPGPERATRFLKLCITLAHASLLVTDSLVRQKLNHGCIM